MPQLYRVDELKTLKEGDLVLLEYNHHDDGYWKSNVPVVMVDTENVYFDCGMDFPFNDDCGRVETDYAIMDDGDSVFKVFKVN